MSLLLTMKTPKLQQIDNRHNYNEFSYIRWQSLKFSSVHIQEEQRQYSEANGESQQDENRGPKLKVKV